MKLKYINFLILFILFSTVVNAQCEKKIIDKTFKTGLTKIKTYDYNLLKHYKLDAQNGRRKQIKYSYVFSLGTKYMLTLSNAPKNIKGIKFSIYDGAKRLVATNYSKKTGKYYSAIKLNCKKTGVYYIKFSFDSTKEYCAGAVLGFKR